MLNSVKDHFLFYSRFLLLVSAAVLMSCGGGGDGGSSATSTVSGTAATGAAIDGTVSAYGSNGGMVDGVVIDAAGVYMADVSGLVAPYLLVAVPSDTNLAQQYSFAAGPGTANITPMTSLAVAIANGNQNPATLADEWPANQASVVANLSNAQNLVNANFANLFESLNTDFNIFSSDFIIGDSFDQFLDIVDVDVSNGASVITINGQAFVFDSNIGTGGAGGGTNVVGGGAAGATGALAITGAGAFQLPVTSLSFIFVSISPPAFILPGVEEQSWTDAAGTTVTIAFNPQNQVIAVGVESKEGVNNWGLFKDSGLPNVTFDGNTASFDGITLNLESAGDSAQVLVLIGTLSN